MVGLAGLFGRIPPVFSMLVLLLAWVAGRIVGR
jgi:hypothetical protein